MAPMTLPSTSPRFWTVACALAFFWTGLPAFAADAPGEKQAAKLVEGRPIDAGFVVLQGRYLSPPYVVGQRAGDLFINGQPIGSQWIGGHPMGPPGMWPRRPGPGFGPGWRLPSGQGAGRFPAQNTQFGRVAWLERQLRAGALVVGFDRDTMGVIPHYKAIAMLTTLVSDVPNETKEEALANLDVLWLSSAQWRKLVATFEPSADLAERLRVLAEEQRRRQDSEAVAGGAVQGAAFGTAITRYALTVGAMVLAVVALGTLLNHRPKTGARWGDLDAAGDGVRPLVRNVVLLAVLGLFDLACTLIAKQVGGMIELNPLGGQLAANPVALAAFKVTTLVLVCGILLALRRYRGAQAVSWWLCLVCTVLAFRWAAYTSLFLA